MAKGILRTKDQNGRIVIKPTYFDILKRTGKYEYIAETPDGVRCRALFSPSTGKYYASDFRLTAQRRKEA